MHDPSATWVLDNSRPDLIENWFQYRVNDCRQLVSRAREAVFGGVQGDQGPAKIVEQVTALRQKGHYTFLLACEAWDKQKSSWPKEESDRMNRVAKSAIDQMTAATGELVSLHQLVVKIDEEARDMAAVICDQGEKEAE